MQAPPGRRCQGVLTCSWPKLALDDADLLQAAAHAPLGDAPQRLAHDGAAHLGLADGALGEGDGHLDDLEAGLDGAPGEVDLEAVALRGHRLDVDLLQDLAAKRLEAA